MKTKDNLSQAHDDIYAQLLEAHRGLSDTQSAELNTRLVLLLVNELGAPDRLEALLKAAREGS